MSQIYVFDTNIISEVLDNPESPIGKRILQLKKDFNELPIRKENWLHDGAL